MDQSLLRHLQEIEGLSYVAVENHLCLGLVWFDNLQPLPIKVDSCPILFFTELFVRNIFQLNRGFITFFQNTINLFCRISNKKLNLFGWIFDMEIKVKIVWKFPFRVKQSQGLSFFKETDIPIGRRWFYLNSYNFFAVAWKFFDKEWKVSFDTFDGFFRENLAEQESWIKHLFFEELLER